MKLINRLSTVLLLANFVIVLFLPLVNAVPSNPTITLQSWSSPQDQYGQGIYQVQFYNNGTGSWVTNSGIQNYTTNPSITMNGTLLGADGNGVKLRVYNRLNATLTGANVTTGFNYQKHYIAVYDSHDNYVWGQENFTFDFLQTAGDMILYEYVVIFGFIPVWGERYNVLLTYSTFYQNDDPSGEPLYGLLAKWDFGNVTGFVDYNSWSYTYDVSGVGYVDDNSAGAYDGFAYYTISLDQITKMVTKVDYIRAGSKAAIYYDCVNSSITHSFFTSTGVKTVEFGTPFNITWVAIGWSDGNANGYNMVSFDYLYLYETIGYLGWQNCTTIETTVYVNLYQGMLLAGVSLIGLILIPVGSIVGALMVKAKKLNEENWLTPLFIICLGFALFIGAIVMMG